MVVFTKSCSVSLSSWQYLNLETQGSWIIFRVSLFLFDLKWKKTFIRRIQIINKRINKEYCRKYLIMLCVMRSYLSHPTSSGIVSNPFSTGSLKAISKVVRIVCYTPAPTTAMFATACSEMLVGTSGTSSRRHLWNLPCFRYWK